MVNPIYDRKMEKLRSPNQRSFFQPKLKVNTPGDKYEKEADAVANKVMESSNRNTSIQKTSPGGDPLLQTKPLADTISSPAKGMSEIPGKPIPKGMEQSILSQGGGTKLPADTLTWMESRFGADFGDVKVHTDSAAGQLSKGLHAKAFTRGNHIFFNQGEFNPGSAEGKSLLAHELTHVVQQGEKEQTSIQRDEDEEASEQNEDSSFEFDFNLLPPTVQFTLGQWMLEANTSRVALQFSQGLMRSRFGYNYGGDLFLGARNPRSSGQLGFNPGSTQLSLSLSHDQFRLGGSYNPRSGGFGLNLGYGARLLPMATDLAGPVNAGWSGVSSILGDLGNMQDPISFYRAHSDDVDGVMGTVKALQPLADPKYRGFGAGLRFTYNPTTGVLIYGGVQWAF